MSLHFQRDLDKLKKEILLIGGLVEEAINNSIQALKNRDAALAQAVIDKEYIIDEKEVHIEEECLKVLALHQPVATDLRFVVVILKVNNDLERMGDFASKGTFFIRT
jgi:phosphate transport system protein